MLFVEKVKTKMGRACLVTRVSCFSRSTSKRELIYLNISVARVLVLLVRARSLEIFYHSRFSKLKVSLRISCTFGPRISWGSIQWSFFAGNTPEINGYLPEKRATLSSSSNRCPPKFFKSSITQVRACARQGLRMRSW